MKLTIGIPCYSEAKTIRTIVDRVRNAPVASKEIILVDDCSRDGPGDLLRTPITPLVDRILYHEVNQGEGATPRPNSGAAARFSGVTSPPPACRKSWPRPPSRP
jgi:hypothetical protein